MLRVALADFPLVYLAGDKFAKTYMRARKDRGIHLKSLRFSRKPVDRAKHTDYATLDKEVRVAPNNLEVQSSIVIWDDSVVAVSTTPTIQIVWFRDPNYAETLERWFDMLWEHSHPGRTL